MDRSEQDAPSRAHWYTLFVVLVYEFACGVDIAQVSLLVKPIEETYHIGDTAFAAIAISSLAFGRMPLYYLGGILADTYRRRNIMLLSGVLWTLAAFSVLFAAHHASQLFAARFLSGIALSIGGASIFHIILDSFSRNRRTFAVSLFGVGVALGIGLGLALCGGIVRLADQIGALNLPLAGLVHPWQLCFVFIGLLGIGVCLLLLTIREPTRLDAASTAQHRTAIVSLRSFLQYMRRNAIFWCVFLTLTFLYTAVFEAITNWEPTLANRVYHLSLPAAGALLGTVSAAASIVGRLFGGSIGQILVNRNKGAQIPWIFVYCSALTAVFALVFPLVSSFTLSTAFLAVVLALIGINTMLYANAVQDIVPNEVRGQVIGIGNFFSPISTLVGTVGLAFVGDHYFGGGTGIRYAFSIVCAGCAAISAIGYVFCVRPYLRARADLERTSAPDRWNTDVQAAPELLPS